MDLTKIQDKKFAIVLGSGYDGTGMTRAVIEMLDWCEAHNIKTKVFSYDKPGQGKNQLQKLVYTPFTKDNTSEIAKEINRDFDVVMFHSTPVKTFDHGSILEFYNFVKSIEITKVQIDHSSTATVVNTMSNIVAIANEMDLLYAFGPAGSFGQSMHDLLASKKIGDRIKRLNLWFDFDKLEKNRNKSFSERERKIIYIGRFAFSKNTHKVLDLGKAIHDANQGMKVEMHGIDGAMASKVNIFDNPYAIRKGKTDKSGPEGCVEVFGPYKRDEIMETVSNSLFGVSFFYSGEHDSNKMEYAQIELIANGCVPIFDQEWGMNFESRHGGKYADIQYSAIYIDRNNPGEHVDWILDTANDKGLWEARQQFAFDAAKREFDINSVLPEMLTEMATISHDTNKYPNIEAMLLDITKSEEFVTMYKQYEDQVVLLNPSQLSRKNLCLLDGKKQNLIKHFK